MRLLDWIYKKTVRNRTMFFCVVWVAIGTFGHRMGFIGAFIYLPMIYLGYAIDRVRLQQEGEDE